MQQKGFVGILVAVIVVVVIAAAAGFYITTRPRVSEQGALRPDTPTPTSQDPAAARNQITEQGLNAEMTIGPIKNNTLEGRVTITVVGVPDETQSVGFVLIKLATETFEDTGPNLGIDKDPSDGWSMTINTSDYDNGNYTLGTVVYSSAGEGADPLDAVAVDLEINN